MATCSKRVILLISVLTSLVILIGILSIIVFIPTSSLLSFFGYTDKLAIADPSMLSEPHASYLVGKLVRDGALVSLKDVWSFQTGFYQTIITFLIAINALIAAVAVIYIKSNSEEKAEEITKRYMDSELFDLQLSNKVERKTEDFFGEAQKDFYKSVEDIGDALTTLDMLSQDNISIRQQLRVIANKVASLDNTDSEGSDSRLIKRGE